MFSSAAYLERFRGAHLVVAGEVGIDEYLWGETRRISPEAPVPVVEVSSQTRRLGLAGNVAQNLTALGARASLVTVRGEDADGEKLAELLKDAAIVDCDLITDTSRPTLRKVRVIAQKQHLLRVDYEKVHGLDPAIAKRFVDSICERMEGADGVIVQDYGKGLWNADTMGFLKHARAKGIPVFVDPSRNSPLSLYRGCTLLTPNTAEAEVLCRLPRGTGVDEMAREMLKVTDAQHAIITCGEAGMVSLSRGETELVRIPTFAREVFDVTGAGDTVIAVLSLMASAGYPLRECMGVANAAAGVVVAKIGAATCSPSELTEALANLSTHGLGF